MPAAPDRVERTDEDEKEERRTAFAMPPLALFYWLAGEKARNPCCLQPSFYRRIRHVDVFPLPLGFKKIIRAGIFRRCKNSMASSRRIAV